MRTLEYGIHEYDPEGMDRTWLREKLSRVLLIIPSLDPDGHLTETVEGMISAGFSRILLVNDGSSPDHLQPFEALTAAHPEVSCTGYAVNRGKGHALKTGFRWALDNCPGLTGVVTADGDGQHSPKDTVRTALCLLEHPDLVVMGSRDFDAPGVPSRNKAGNKITRFVFRVLYGMNLADAQTGLRGTPVTVLKDFLEVEGERFEYESNLFIAMKDLSIGFVNLYIDTIYIDSGKGSHFRPLQDSVRIYKPIVLYLCSSAGSALVDLAAFTLIFFLLKKYGAAGGISAAGAAGTLLSRVAADRYLLIATAAARVLSSVCNYLLNRKAVFRSKAPAGKTLARYYLLAVLQLLVSWKGVSLLTAALKAGGFCTTLVKMAVDLVLAVISFRVQRVWVFRDGSRK